MISIKPQLSQNAVAFTQNRLVFWKKNKFITDCIWPEFTSMKRLLPELIFVLKADHLPC